MHTTATPAKKTGLNGPKVAAAARKISTHRRTAGGGGFQISKRTLKGMDKAMENLRRGKVSAPVNLRKYDGR